MKPNILESNLFNPGVKFIATDDVKDTTLPPNSIGFFSYFKNPDRDYQDVVYARVSIIRRGKSGQQRVEQKDISFPIFTDKKMLEQEDYLPIGRKFYLHIQKEMFSNAHLMEVSHLEFLGWAFAYSKYLKYLVGNFVHPSKRANWSEKTVGDSLMSGEKITAHWANDPAATVVRYASEEFRRDYIIAARRLESKLIKCIFSYKKSVIASILNSAHFLEFTNKNYYEVVDKKLAKNTVSFYKEKYKQVEATEKRNLAANKRKER